MIDRKKVLRSLRFLTNGETLFALVFLAAGIFVLREGFLKLKAFWIQFAPLFPLSIPGYSDQKLLMSLPQVINLFINVVSSLCALLIGLLWTVSGLAEAFQSLKSPRGNAKWQDSGVVAEILQTGRAQNWKSFVWLVRPLAEWWPRLRAASPISYEFVGVLLRAACKIVFTGIVIGLTFYFLRVAPSLVQQHFQIDIRFFVPSPRPLYFLLGFMLVVYGLTALSLFPFRIPRFDRTCQALPVRGKGDAHLFFALLEEGGKLLTGRKSPHRPSSTRLESDGKPSEKGTLIESSPELFRSWANPAAYCYLPVVFMLLIMGFTRLIHFRRATGMIPHTEFFRYYFVDYMLEVAFAIGLIIVGIRLAEMARKLFGVQRYRSALVFCHVTPGAVAGDNLKGDLSDPENPSGKHTGPKWKGVEATDDQFARWVKGPTQTQEFQATLCWGEAVSTSAGPDGPRYLTDLRRSSSLDDAMERILQIPFNVDFEADLPSLAGDEREHPEQKLP